MSVQMIIKRLLHLLFSSAEVFTSEMSGSCQCAILILWSATCLTDTEDNLTMVSEFHRHVRRKASIVM